MCAVILMSKLKENNLRTNFNSITKSFNSNNLSTREQGTLKRSWYVL